MIAFLRCTEHVQGFMMIGLNVCNE